MENLKNVHKDCSNQREKKQKLCNGRKVLHFEFKGKSMETGTTTWSEYPNEGKTTVEQKLVSEGKS